MFIRETSQDSKTINMSQKMEEKNVEDRNINRKSNPKTNRPLPHEKQNGNHDRSTSTASLNPAMRYRLKKLNSKEESKNDIIEQNKSQKCDHLEGVGELYHKDNNSYSDDEDLDNSDSTSKIRSCSNNSNESNRNSDKKKNEFNTEISKGINKSENAKNFNRSNKINGKSFENEKEFKEAKRLRIAMLKRRYAALNPVPFDPYAIPVIVKDLIDFVTLPFQSKQGTVMRCFIERAKGFVVPTYTLFSDHEDGSGRMIMTAQKTMISNTSYYTISLNPDDLSKRRGNRSIQYLGKLRGNRALTEYILYDNGSTPEEIEEMKIDFDGIDEEDRPQIRKELAAISFLSGRGHSAYTANLKSIKGGNSSSEGKYDGDSSEEENADLKVDIDVRKMEVGIPKVHYHFPLEDNGKPDLNQPEVNRMEKWSPRVAKESLKEGLNRIQFQGLQNVLDCNRIIVMHQKESKYDPISSCLCDFKGRATAPSTKNFQIIFSSPEDTDAKDHFFSSEGEGREVNSDPEAAQPILLQMGRVGNDCFNVDLQHPLSILQAFAICLAKFDSKR